MKEYPISELSTAFFVMCQEKNAWKVIIHEDDSVQAVRQGGQLLPFKSRSDAQEHVDALAMQAALNYLMPVE